MLVSKARTARPMLSALAGAAAFFAAASGASAQGGDRDGRVVNAVGPYEEVYVYAPRVYVERTSPLGPIEKISLTRPVRYDDLNLRTVRGADELRMRVRTTALDICDQLAVEYPVPQLSGTSCYRSASSEALRRANAAIRDARGYQVD